MSLTNDLSDDFFAPGLATICAQLLCDPIDLLSVMQSESGVTASANNPNTHASGLIQIMPANLPGLGWTQGDAAFRLLSARDQLPFVQAYFQPHVAAGLNSAARLYQVVFLPATLSRGSDLGVEICNNSGDLTPAYNANRIFDTGNKGFITVGDLQNAVIRNRHGARWAEILARFDGRSTQSDGVIDLRTVEGLQSALNQLGFNVGAVDGLFGGHTIAGVTAFQSANGLTSNGIVTSDTQTAIGTQLTNMGALVRD